MRPEGMPTEPIPSDGAEPTGPSRQVLTGLNVIDEHFVPSLGLELEDYIAAGDLTGVHHLVRYIWATRVLCSCAGLGDILDLGCGSGYGTSLLAQALPGVRVLGVDYDPNAVAEANRLRSLPNLRFAAGDPTDWSRTLGDGRYGAIVCFDVIEHVQHRELMLEGIVEHLRPDGALLLSTPCGSPENIRTPGWVHHRIEYAAASLFDFLRRYFGRIEKSDDTDFPSRAVFEELHARGVDYLLRMNPVICKAPITIRNPYR